MTKILVKNGNVVNPGGKSGKLDILIENGKISDISKGIISEDAQVIDADGLTVSPGFVDVHSHFRDPGQTHKEDIFTGAASAAHGGYTSIVLMANTIPTVDSTKTLKYVLDKGSQTDINIFSCANVTYGMQGKELTDFDALVNAGAAGFTDDGKPLMDAELVKTALIKAKALGKIVSFHEEDPSFIENNGINHGKASEHYGIGGSDRKAEISMIERDIKLALETGADIDIQHISTKEGVELVRQGRKKGSNIHAEAAPHHFSLTEEAAIEYGSMAKMNPPLRTEEDRKAVIEGLKDGTIEMIATDHAPHSAEEKAKGLLQAPSGIIGLETALSLALMNLVEPGYLSMEQLIRCISLNPARLYGLDAGVIETGKQADITIFDPAEEWIADSFFSRSSNTPFKGMKLHGKIKKVICKGKIII
ncbi:MAG: dihydroorotase [Lachnospiraceae bacterium]|nr:dihydroorotase [Lachnospiraceae bacterium]